MQDGSPNNLTPRTGEAMDFLKRWYEERPFTLVSIHPETGKISAKTFSSDQRSHAYAWIEERQGKENLYFHVNAVNPATKNKKVKNEDIIEVLTLHVDIDDKNARQKIERSEPRPTITIWSGNGIHAYWRYTTSLTDVTAAARKNYAMAKKLDADHCHDVSRILRLPGTINIPTQKKREKGRVPELAYVISQLTDWNRRYDPEDFEEMEPQKGGSLITGGTVKLSTLDDLPENVSARCKSLIIYGDDPENPRGSKNATYLSRSEPLFAVCCELARRDCSDEIICGILLNPLYKISESVLEKSNAHAYAQRQVRKARETVSTEWPDTFNNGKPKKSYENAIAAIRRIGVTMSYNTFSNRMTVSGIAIQEFQGELNDNLCAALRQAILEEFKFDPGRVPVQDAIQALCLENVFHPVREYLHRISWDNVPRLETMLARYFGAADTPLNRAISKLMMMAAVRRIMSPGIKFDTIVVLEGPQGSGKSSALAILTGQEHFCDADLLTLEAKGQMEAMEGVWIFEICELEGLKRSEASKVKAFASRTHDKARMAFARFSDNRPRQNIFIGTTNDDQYLKDETGNRRFLPVRTGNIDLEALQRDRDQLWAEAVLLEAKGESITLPKEFWADAAHEQDLRMVNDSWMDILRLHAEEEAEKAHGFLRLPTTQILREILDISEGQQQTYHATRLAPLMRKLGWDGPKTITMENGKKVKGYERPMNEEAPF